MVKIREIFSSIQGEGPFVGYKQLFIRFCKCNLNCKYCDTDFEIQKAKDYTKQDLINIVNSNLDCHSISLTGGEPLLDIDFLKEFLPECNLPIYLETNSTLYKNLNEIIDYVDFVAADIKLESSTGNKPLWDAHEKFFQIASKKNLYAKMVFDSELKEEELTKACELSKKYNVELVLQPKMIGNKPSIDSKFIQETLNKCLTIHSKTRVIPQVHKFINVE